LRNSHCPRFSGHLFIPKGIEMAKNIHPRKTWKYPADFKVKAVYKINLVLITLVLIACGSSGNDESDNNTKLVGSWVLTHSNECQETTTYLANGTWTNIALDEVQTGSYVFTDIEASDRYRLAITIEADNGLPDCDGDSELDTGLSLNIFAGFPSELSMELYTSVDDVSPFYTFNKQP